MRLNNNNFINEIIARLRRVLPQGHDFIALHEPCFKGSEWEKVKNCLDTGWVSYAGEYVKEFDSKLATYCGVKHAISTANGTLALHIALKLAGVDTGNEVLMPALTFVASANAVAYLNAVPHFVDSCPETLGIDPIRLKDYLARIADVNDAGACINKITGKRIAALMPVHVFGHPCDMDALNTIAAQYKIPVVEDAAESFGSEYKKKPMGGFGQIAALSFNGNKIVTTGGGGAILTNDDELAARARHITTTAKVKHPWRFIHDEIGYNYRMPNINAALGCAQMEQVDGFLKSKRALAQRYADVFADMDAVKFFKEPDFGKSNYWLNALLLHNEQAGSLEPLLEATNKAGIMTRPVWDLMDSLPMYANCPAMKLETARNLASRLINIPSSAFLGARDL